jgi:hypothetical protein
MFASGAAWADVKATVAHNTGDDATTAFKFKNVPSPAKADSAPKAKFTIVDGERDEAGAELEAVHDGKLPSEADQPSANFFFNAGTEGGRIGVDLGSVIEIKQINTYSWHTDTRAPQVYKLYASDGTSNDFKAAPKKGTDPAKAGWKLLVAVDTRPKTGDVGGQYGVSVADKDGMLGKFQYLLFDVSRTEEDDTFGNTFFSEINIIDAKGTSAAATPEKKGEVTTLEIAGGKYVCTLDTTEAPMLTEWANAKIGPLIKDYYPKIVEALPSEGFEAPKRFSVTFTPSYKGVAATIGGTRIVGSTAFYIAHPDDIGSIYHEMVHVVQQYGLARRRNPNAERVPIWLQEGIPDYLRWYIYEPQSHGADIRRSSISKVHYDDKYRVSANFLNYVTETYHQKDLVVKLNTALREGKYNADMFKTLTGKNLDELNDDWKAALEKKTS